MALKAKPFKIEWSRPGGDTKQIDTDLKEQLFRVDSMLEQLFTGIKSIDDSLAADAAAEAAATADPVTLLDTDSSHTLTLDVNENLTANRTLNFITGDADRTLTLSANLTVSSATTLPQTTITGNAATATALETARTINGTSFNGTANITVTADANTLTNTTLASGVVTSSLTTLGTAVDLRTSTSNFGYRTGAGGTVTQVGSKSSSVTLNEACGYIQMDSSALAADTIVSFTLTNSTIAADDLLVLNHQNIGGSGGTRGAYIFNADCDSGAATIFVTNISTGSLSENVIIYFALIKGVTS